MRAGILEHLRAQILKALHACRNLCLARLDFECRPTAVGKLNYRIRLKARIVPVVAHGHVGSQLLRSGVHHKVSDAEVLENRAKGLPIV